MRGRGERREYALHVVELFFVGSDDGHCTAGSPSPTYVLDDLRPVETHDTHERRESDQSAELPGGSGVTTDTVDQPARKKIMGIDKSASCMTPSYHIGCVGLL